MSAFTSRQLIMPVLAVVVLAISIGWMAGAFDQKVAPGLLDASTDKIADTLEVSLTSVPVTEAAVASLSAQETTLISSRIMARIDKILVRAGDQVKQGAPLLTLENRDLVSQLDQSRARLGALQGSMEEARNSLARIQNLRTQGLASSADLDKAQANFTQISGDILAAEQAQKEAETALSYSTIHAPIDGRIVERHAEPGNMATPGSTLLSLYNPRSLLVEASVREALAIHLYLGQQLNVQLEALNLKVVANIAELVPAADPNAHSFTVKATIAYDEQLKPGMFARLLIPLEDQQQILIPQDYVESFGQLDRVWVVDNQQLSRRFVRLGEHYSDKVEVVAGLTPGEKISLPTK